MRPLLLAAVVVALACRGEVTEQHIRNMSTGISSTGGQPDQILTYEFEMPQGWSVTMRGRATLVDESGRSFEAQQMGGSRGSSGRDTFRASFRTPDDFQPRFLRMDGYEVNLSNSRIRKTQTPAP